MDEKADSGSSTVCDCQSRCLMCVCVWRVALCCTAGDAFVAVSFCHFPDKSSFYLSAFAGQRFVSEAVVLSHGVGFIKCCRVGNARLL